VHHPHFEFVFANAPRTATGEPEEGIPPEVATWEWWGTPGVPYEDAWKSGFDGFDGALSELVASGPYDGVIGFSQGGGVASLVPSRWFVGFSAVEPPPALARARGSDGRPSLHLFDPAEEYVAQCEAVRAGFAAADKHTHAGGHTVPVDPAAIGRFGQFLTARLEEWRLHYTPPNSEAPPNKSSNMPRPPPPESVTGPTGEDSRA